MASQRLMQFRQQYRARVAGWYNGYAHIATVYAAGAVAYYIYIAHIDNVKPLEWLTIPGAFLFANWFEWYLHKYLMHRPPGVTPLRVVYYYHMLDHHQFFTDEDMRFRDHRDWRITIFPPYALTIFILASMPFAIVLGYGLSSNVAWLFLCVTTANYLIYEIIHFCCHVEENWFVRHCPLINSARRHHTAHHNTRLMMEVNMNVTFPVTDWLLGTSDLERGLIGHLFNGYDTRYLKKTLRSMPRPPGSGATSHEPSAGDDAATSAPARR